MEDKLWAECDNRIDAMYGRIDAAIREHGRGDKTAFVSRLKNGLQNFVIYSAYDDDENELPIDNLDEVVFEGTCIVVGEYDEFWDGRGVGLIGDPIGERKGQAYCSKSIHNPTWLDIAVLANESIICTNDLHHVFLESVTILDEILYLSFGS